MLIERSTPDKVMVELKKFKNVKVLKTSLSQEQEDKLKAAFAATDVKLDMASRFCRALASLFI
jgi:uncharacterized membrane protein